MKVLIYFHERYLAPSGGPSGYLYNLKEYCDAVGDEEILFLNPKDFHSAGAFKVKNKLHHVFGTDHSLPAQAQRIEQIIFESRQDGPYDLSGFDAVHFHSTSDMYTQKKNLENYKGKVILTSHTPKAPFLELVEDVCTPEEYEMDKEIFDRAKEFDEYAFSRADYVVFPCGGAEEPYFHTWEKYAQIRDEKKMLYLPTGTRKCAPKRSRSEVRKELGIPEDRFVISFVGRHNEVKGYDRLQVLFGKMENVTVLCCGNPGRIVPPESENWIEAGWTDDPYSYVNASDLFILPNKETYFDLALLETLSYGKSMLISRTGGNKLFEDMEERGIYLFGTDEEAVSAIKKVMNETPEVTSKKEAAQVKLFEEKYTMDRFYTAYKDLLRRVLET